MSKAQHPKAASFVRQNLFVGVKSFAELEARIAALPDEQSRGGAFEVFAEAYLVTQRTHDAAKIWPFTSVPTAILQTLGLGQQDYGVDGVFQTLLGNFNAYQVKFRANRPALTWRELSTFMGLADSPHVRSRVLITNCDELASVLNERQGFFCIRGSDLDRLEADDFHAIEVWLADAAFVPPKKRPQPHQTEALDALLLALQTHDRVSAIMACGTGKTLVALWIAERVAQPSTPASSGGIPAARILVLVPSLALLRQTLHEWLRETSLSSLAYLCVCSDPTVKEGIDAIATAQSDLDFQVSTDAASVRDFLDAPFDGTKIIFSTYQSAQVVGAALKPGEVFDLAMFDEAHKTAGREGRNYAFALEDSNLPIRKRLFLTATPRHYNPLRKDKEGDAQLVFSMDRPEVYGPQAYRLTFAKAARRGIICGYKVIISVITSEMVTNELLSHGEVFVNGDAVRARQVANQIALRDAIDKYDVKKIFTFHSTVKSAASFVADGSEGIGTHLSDVGDDVRRLTSKQNSKSHRGKKSQSLVTSSPTNEFQTFHVNGTMPTARREREMRDFRATARAVMSNARCLTEGVDVPAVDMVAFLSPRRSRVDIVQATGRAMRRSPGKTTGYVLVPLYLEQAAGESVEEAVNRAEFDEVWDVLQSLQEQDDVLAEIIRAMREERGRTKGFDDSRFRERVDLLGPRLALSALREAITSTCIDLLGAAWDERFGELKVYKERYGHCTVPEGWCENKKLAVWVALQRTRRIQGKLAIERIARLNNLGFIWHPHEAAWEDMFLRLEEYKQVTGSTDVPVGYPQDPELGRWVTTQRQLRRKRVLTEERVERLDAIGFVWDPLSLQWRRMFDALAHFRRDQGHCQVPASWKPNPQLSYWVQVQRRMKKQGKISDERVEQLARLGFVWETTDDHWEEYFAALTSYRKAHGDCNIPRAWPQNPKLGSWVHGLRKQKRTGELSEDRIQRLNRHGFVWNPHNSAWEEMFAALVAFRKAHGNCDVPVSWPNSLELGQWVAHQRQLNRIGRLDIDRVERLERLGFVWEIKEDKWESLFRALSHYKLENGDCKVPLRWKENPQLGRWVGQQRLRRKQSKLSSERIRKLDSVGFTWSATESNWEEMFAALVAYKKKFGDCDVGKNLPENSNLGEWVSWQRTRMNRGQLSRNLAGKLDSIGFIWAVRDAFWEKRFGELVRFKRLFGHTLVPVNWQSNSKLGAWVANQRVRKKQGTLNHDRITRLNTIGFQWKINQQKSQQ